jgi:hypothetical protein
MNPMISRLLAIIAALVGVFCALWLTLGITTSVNGRPVICDVWWWLVAVPPLAVVVIIIYWTNWRGPS